MNPSTYHDTLWRGAENIVSSSSTAPLQKAYKVRVIPFHQQICWVICFRIFREQKTIYCGGERGEICLDFSFAPSDIIYWFSLKLTAGQSSRHHHISPASLRDGEKLQRSTKGEARNGKLIMNKFYFNRRSCASSKRRRNKFYKSFFFDVADELLVIIKISPNSTTRASQLYLKLIILITNCLPILNLTYPR